MDYIILIKIISAIAWVSFGEIAWRILYYTPIKFFHKEYNQHADDSATKLTRGIRPILIVMGLFSLITLIYLLYTTVDVKTMFFKYGLTLYYKVPDDNEKEEHETEIS